LDHLVDNGYVYHPVAAYYFATEVCRTRLRQKAPRHERRYHSFFQTLFKVWRDEGMRGIYGGMSAHLIRVVPNTAIVFLTYEAVVQLIDDRKEKSLYGH